MDTHESRTTGHLLLWITTCLLLLSFGLADTAVVVWSASLATVGQLAAAAIAFTLIGTGLVFTVWQIRR